MNERQPFDARQVLTGEKMKKPANMLEIGRDNFLHTVAKILREGKGGHSGFNDDTIQRIAGYYLGMFNNPAYLKEPSRAKRHDIMMERHNELVPTDHAIRYGREGQFLTEFEEALALTRDQNFYTALDALAKIQLAIDKGEEAGHIDLAVTREGRRDGVIDDRALTVMLGCDPSPTSNEYSTDQLLDIPGYEAHLVSSRVPLADGGRQDGEYIRYSKQSEGSSETQPEA